MPHASLPPPDTQPGPEALHTQVVAIVIGGELMGVIGPPINGEAGAHSVLDSVDGLQVNGGASVGGFWRQAFSFCWILLYAVLSGWQMSCAMSLGEMSTSPSLSMSEYRGHE